MALSVKDPETDRLAREVARLTGESLTEVVRKALADRLERERRRRGLHGGAREAIERIRARLRKEPVHDDRSPEAIIGYDVKGLPG